MLAVQAVVFFGVSPPSGAAAASSVLLAYGVFAAYVARWEARHPSVEKTLTPIELTEGLAGVT
jgi:hypothetical protein